MNRIADPLKKMNARIQTTNGCLPLSIEKSDLSQNSLNLQIPSAQINLGYYWQV